MTFDWKPLLLLLALMLLGGLAYWFYGIAEEQRQRADTAERNLKLANDTITDMQTRQRDVAALDAKYTKELADANAENDRLRAGHFPARPSAGLWSPRSGQQSQR